MFYYSDIFIVADYHHAESRVKDLIGRFVDKKGKEFYQLHYTELREIVKYICERYTEEVEKINEGLSRLVASLNVQRLRTCCAEASESRFVCKCGGRCSS